MSWLFYTLTSAALWAFVPILAKLSLHRIDPVVLTTIRSSIVTMFLLCYCFFTKKCAGTAYCNTSRLDWYYLLIAGFLSAASWLLYFTAIKIGPISKIAAVQRISFVLVIILAGLFFNEPITGYTIAGITFMFIGMWMIAS